MSCKTSRESRDAALSKLYQKKSALKQSRLRHVEEIIRIDHTLNEIEAEGRKIVNEASPLLNLPAEITCMIFDFYITTYDYIKYPKFGKKVLLPEVVVSHVCSRWRGISLNYPQLWATYCSRPDSFKTVGNPFDRFDTYMERSGSQNLELFFDFGGLPFDPRELFGKVLKLVKRWKTVTLLVEDEHVPPDLLMASAPNLEYFAYLLTPDYDPRPIRTAINSSNPRIFQGGAPKLRYLWLDCSSQTRLPQFSNTTTLRIETDFIITHAFYSWETYLEILTIPSLVNLSINGTISTVPQSKDVRVVTMNNLKHLRYGRHEFMTLLLPWIRAPLLETLSIFTDNGRSQRSLGPNPFGIPKESYFFPSLQTLMLVDSTTSSPDSVWRIMQMTKNVISILISHNLGCGEGHFFDGLRKHGRFNDEFWPKLTSLTANIYPYYCSKSVTEFVLSRPKNDFMLRLSRDTDLEIQTENPDEYKEIQENCTVKVLTAEEETAFRPLWPPGVDCPEYVPMDDPFHLDITL